MSAKSEPSGKIESLKEYNRWLKEKSQDGIRVLEQVVDKETGAVVTLCREQSITSDRGGVNYTDQIRLFWSGYELLKEYPWRDHTYSAQLNLANQLQDIEIVETRESDDYFSVRIAITSGLNQRKCQWLSLSKEGNKPFFLFRKDYEWFSQILKIAEDELKQQLSSATIGCMESLQPNTFGIYGGETHMDVGIVIWTICQEDRYLLSHNQRVSLSLLCALRLPERQFRILYQEQRINNRYQSFDSAPHLDRLPKIEYDRINEFIIYKNKGIIYGDPEKGEDPQIIRVAFPLAESDKLAVPSSF